MAWATLSAPLDMRGSAFCAALGRLFEIVPRLVDFLLQQLLIFGQPLHAFEIVRAEILVITKLGQPIGQLTLLHDGRPQPFALADQFVGQPHLFDVLGRPLHLLLIRLIEGRLLLLEFLRLRRGSRPCSADSSDPSAVVRPVRRVCLASARLLLELLAQLFEIVAVRLFQIVQLRLCGPLVHVLGEPLRLFGEFLELLLELLHLA